jgi:hypothetical protein
MVQPKGTRGSWFADWRGESLPCVHKCWFKAEANRVIYCDPGLSDDPRWDSFIAAIRTGGRVILTEDEQRADGFPVTRAGYIALYQVENVSTESGELRFDFVKRLAEFT